MGNVIRKVSDHVPEGLFGDNIFLATDMAVFAMDDGATIKAVLFSSLWYVGQCKILLKNKYKKIQAA